MKKHVYLITTAAVALLAGTAFAAAQGMQKQAPSSGAEQSPPSQGQTQGQQPKKEQTQPGQRRGEPQGQKGQPQTQGQGQKQDQLQTQGQGGQQQPGQTPAQRPQKEQTQQGQTPQQGQDKQGAQQKSGGSVTFTTEQRTSIRTTVLQGSNAPRATNVNFSINVGTVVPRSVRVVGVPQLIVDVHSDWRGLMYFIVDDQIIIVDRNNRIVAVFNV